MDTLVEVGKWVLLVMAAGFVGQFGKSLAQAILERRKARKASASAPSPPRPPRVPQAPPGEMDPKVLKKQAKLEKKRLKAEAKRAKKAGLPPGRDVSK